MSPAAVVDRNLAAYGASDLEAIAATFAPDVAIGPLHGAPLAVGREAARTAYAQTIQLYPMSGTTSVGRIVLPGAVIDQEVSRRVDGAMRNVLTIYRLEGGAIGQVSTVVSAGPPDGEALAQRQLDAYNAQDLDAYCACFAADCIIAEFGEPPAQIGRSALRERYAALFAAHPANHAALIQRLAVGPVVIDHERVRRTPEGEAFEVAAVYTIAEGLIARVDFLR